MNHQVKLTLSAERRIVQKAKRLARMRGTSVSAMFSHFVEGLAEPVSIQDLPLGPLTEKALGLARLPKNKPASKVLTEELMKKYGLNK